MKKAALVAICLSLFALSGCYRLTPSRGGGEAKFTPPRQYDPADIALPPGYKIELVARDLTFPTGATFDNDGRLYIVESGYCYGEVFTTPRLLRIEQNQTPAVIATGSTNGPWTGVVFHDGAFFVSEGGVMEGGKILRITLNGEIRAIVDGLPSFGDHHTDAPAVSRDGWIYFGQGTASNSGVIGTDNAKFGWLKRRPDFHDIPARDITLTGQNFKTYNPLKKGSNEEVWTGAFVPFGTKTTPGQVIKGQLKATGCIFRVRPDGSDLQQVAWGFRNPFALAFAPDGKLYATDNSYDDRGSRPVWGTADVLWRVEPNLWYGWPDFSGNDPLNNGDFNPPRKNDPKPLLANHPNTPPAPITKFPVHSSADGLDFSRNENFGHIGEAFVALFGDQVPDVGKSMHPVGFKIVRVNIANSVTEDFAVNNGPKNGPASKLGHGGLERPVSVRFSPDGAALYVIDFGVLLESENGANPQKNTGCIWRITRS